MRELKSGDTIIRVRASNLARMYFYQEFGAELDKELDKLLSSNDSREAEALIKGLDVETTNKILDLQNIAGLPPQEAVKQIESSGLMDRPELLNAMMKLGLQETISTSIPVMSVMRIAWAMNKAQNLAENLQTRPFEQWVMQYEDFDFYDCLDDFWMEVKQGFFRSENNSEG